MTQLAIGETTSCLRCGARCQRRGDPGEHARILRRAVGEGLCASCAITVFLKKTTPLDVVIEAQGPACLLVPAIQAQVARVLAAGQSDASPLEIDWPTVVGQWELPLPKGARGYG